MTFATIWRSRFTPLLLSLFFALGTAGCPSAPGGGQPDSETPADIDAMDGPEVDIDIPEVPDPDEIGGDEIDTVHVPDADTTPACPDTLCEIGTVNCLTDGVERTCVAFDEVDCPGVGEWSEAVECAADAVCVANEGCACNMGACEGDDTSACIAPAPLGACEQWACVDDCCAIEEIPPPDCCLKAQDCDDGDECTQDLCDLQTHLCINTQKVDTGLCDDGDPCTEEGCDPATGDCTNTFNPALDGCGGNDCWGTTQEDANLDHCVIDPCVMPTCDYESGFLAWDEVYDPDCGTQAEYCGKCDTSIPTDCDDGKECTIDICEPGVGCVYALNEEDPNCFCIDTADCMPLIEGLPCQEVECLVADHICAQSLKDCDDGADCTLDYCDLELDACQHQILSTEGPCGDLICYNDSYCDDYLAEEFGADCACKAADCVPVVGTGYGLCDVQDVGCPDNDPCTVYICDTSGEECACAGVPIDCADEDPCTADTCDELLGCVHGPLDVDDGNPCTIDTCDPEAVLTDYIVNIPVVCEEQTCKIGTCNFDTGLCDYTWDPCDDLDPCTLDECVLETGECLHVEKVCNDGNPCTIDDCDALTGDPDLGFCVTEDIDCGDGNQCTEDVCNPVTGTCMHPPIYCNDGDACTIDSCDTEDGCIGYEQIDCTDCIHPVTGETEMCPGGNASPGFEMNPCTMDTCNPSSGCQNIPVGDAAVGCGGCLSDVGGLDDSACDDGNLCTDDVCVCTSGTPEDCAEATCESGDKACECPGGCADCFCDPLTGECGAVPGNCTDCIHPEYGEIVACPGVIPEGFVRNLCTLDACSLDTGECIYTDVNCFDNNLCTEDLCNPVAGCTFPALTCDDEMACTVDTCTPGAGCLHTLDCVDEDPCTADSCGDEEPFECQFVAMDCDDDNPCTADICGEAGICLYEQTDCDDDDLCTVDMCDQDLGDPDDAYCLHPPVICDDLNPCTNDVCHPLNGQCYFQAVSCDDCVNPSTDEEVECPDMAPEGFVKNLCTEDFAVVLSIEECLCTHTEIATEDGDFCTTDTCDPAVGVVNEPIVCEPDGNPCTTETCNPLSGGCSSTLVDCEDDGDPCTEDVPEAVEDPELGLICACVAKPLDCDDNDACTTDTQVIDAGLCSCTHVEIVCEDDGDPCTTDVCLVDEGCIHDQPECEDGDVCTYDWCDPELAEISTDPDVYCVHEEKTCQDCINPETLELIENCLEPPEGYVYNECSQGDYCDLALGGCQYPEVTQCPPDQDLCTLEYCDPESGDCASDPLDCEDGNLCTLDSCEDGQCIQSNAPGAQCVYPSDCADGNPCTQDICATTGDCTCTNPPVSCDDDDCCTLDTCDEGSGECVHTPIYPSCATCAEDIDCLVECPFNPFTGEQVAPDDEESGLCEPSTVIMIDDENDLVVFRDACNDWLCDLDSGQDCGEGVGQCVNTAVICEDNDDCTLDFCDPEIGCFFQPSPTCCTVLTDPPLMDQDPGWDPQISVCFDDDPCTVDSCDYDTGACSYENVVCDDGNACTEDVCEAGEGCSFSWQQGCEYACYNDYDCSAAAGNPGDTLGLCSTELCTDAVDPLGNCLYDEIVCDAGPPCTVGVCDPDGGCSYLPLGEACVDACETDDQCDDGWACSTAFCETDICVVSVTACDDEDPCTRDFCDIETGLCTYADLDECLDDCTELGGDVWCDDDDACTIDWCDKNLHQCMYSPKTCSDGDLCTTDVCDADDGCLFFPEVPCLSCSEDGECDDGNPCTADICKDANPVQETDAGYMADGNAHPDRYCSHASICSECESQLDCDAYVLDHPCVEEAICDTDTQMCEIEFTVCDDGDPCTADLCNPFTGDCQFNEIADCCHTDADCGAVLPCYSPSCEPGLHVCLNLPSLCDDFDPCTADSCDYGLGCVHMPIEECDNECEKPQDCYSLAYGPVSCTIAACLIDEESGMGMCAGAPLECDDGNLCTVDVCLPLMGCQYYPSDPEECTFDCITDVDCDDGIPCTEESCDAETGSCAYTEVVCDDEDPCTVDWCDLATGACVFEACPECSCDDGCLQHLDCDDDSPCTVDICEEGVCMYPTLPCWDGDPCTDDSCDPTGGCMFLPVPTCAGCTSAESCDDGNLCTANECVDQYCVNEDLCAQ